MEFTDLNQENLVNITFMDVMKIVSSDETTPNQKLVYIYLLNVIMDTNERIDKLQQTIDKFNSMVNVDDETLHMTCPICDGDGYFSEEDENGIERTDCNNCCGEGYVVLNEDELDVFPDGKCIEDTISEDVKWYEDKVKGDEEQLPF